MKSKLITGLALVAALLIGMPVFAKDHGGNKGKAKGKVHAQAASHPGKGKQKVKVAKKQEVRGPIAVSRPVKAKPQKIAESRNGAASSRPYVSRDNRYSNDASDGRRYESALARQGYYRVPIDGIVGRGTRSAIAAYQQDNGLAVTGTITDGLRNNLGV